jgi:hypothetical protein
MVERHIELAEPAQSEWRRLCRTAPFGHCDDARPHAQPETHQIFLGGDWVVKPRSLSIWE